MFGHKMRRSLMRRSLMRRVFDLQFLQNDRVWNVSLARSFVRFAHAPILLAGLLVTPLTWSLVYAQGPALPHSVSAEVKEQTSQSSSADKQTTSAVKHPTLILFIGDSLTDGYGVARGEAFPEQVENMLREKGHLIRIINGGVSGSVSAEADRRLRWYLKSKPEILVLALGANDGFKGTPPAVIKRNLAKAIDLARHNNMKILLAGMRMFTNLGPEYRREFEALYADLAREKKVTFIPFLLEGVALNRKFNQADMKHPNAKGHEIVARLVAERLETML
jgi:acyl-CoA thioesterase-1